MKPGRKSTYDLLEPIIPGKPPPPPKELEPDQRLEWEAITARLPVDSFTGENIPMLKELCRHITYARELAGQIMKVRAERNPGGDGGVSGGYGRINGDCRAPEDPSGIAR